MTDKEKLDKYLEFEKDLIIDPTERQKARISELEKNQEKIAELTAKLEEYQKKELSDEDLDRIIERTRKEKPELTRALDSLLTKTHEKMMTAIKEQVDREMGLTPKEIKEMDLETSIILKKIKEREKRR